MEYLLERRRHSGWHSFMERGFRGREPGHDIHFTDNWDVSEYFLTPEDAVAGGKEFRAKHHSCPRMRVVDEDGVVYYEEQGTDRPYLVFVQVNVEVNVSYNPQEEKMSDIEQPLHIPRPALIETLQGRLDEEQAKRQKAEDEKAANRQRVTDAVMSLSTDELVNIVTSVIPASSATDVVQLIEKAKEDGRYKSSETKPTSKETSLDKLVRVLTLSNDETIEVTPADSVYNLL